MIKLMDMGSLRIVREIHSRVVLLKILTIMENLDVLEMESYLSK